jgi:Rrf2 family protein
LYLSIHSDVEKKYSPKDIADVIDIPAPFLAKTLQLLTKNNLISSIRGRNGGFYLTEAEKQNNLLDVIACIDGLDKFNECFIGLPKCSDENPCAIHHIVSPFKEKLTEELTGKTIADFAEETKNGKSYIFLK